MSSHSRSNAAHDSLQLLCESTITQIGVNYRGSRLSDGSAGSVRGGDRLPWVTTASSAGEEDDNFAPLRTLKWQVHVYGECGAGIAEACARRGLALHVFPWQAMTARAGLKQGAVYLVRPDGHIGLADPDASPARLEQYLDTRGVQP
ncbi:hypothetical protein BB934_37650 (plasmid) [Microvirga ossetica]|uniref:FAD-binding domain-containing protein n=1 Tax=Microvirga ossetica TaxID=1882682 RepID=A0A1B2EVM8_9HYPH|nr:hypothetical protein [Microvirga ossetica]ANY83996.1 hypothetical protein BB934_37650 [Microvirga ossetica]